MKQYLHFPKGNGSYTVAENLAKNTGADIWAVGESSSGIYLDGNFPVLFSHPKSSGNRFSELSSKEYREYCASLGKALLSEPNCLKIVHHGFAIAKILGKNSPVVSYLHGTEMLAYNNLPVHIKQDVYDAISLSRKIIVMSDKQRSMAISMFGHILNEDVEILPGGIDTKIFHPYDNTEDVLSSYRLKPGKNTLLFAGRLTVEKNLEVLINAFDSELSKHNQLVIVGSGSEEQKLKDCAKAKDITFVPAMNQQSLARLMSASDLFILPSNYESFGLVVLEAIASGTPVVASDVGVLSQLVSPSEGGYVFKLQDNPAENLKSAIDKTLKLDKKIFKAYAQFVRTKYSWQGIAKIFVEIVKDIR